MVEFNRRFPASHDRGLGGVGNDATNRSAGTDMGGFYGVTKAVSCSQTMKNSYSRPARPIYPCHVIWRRYCGPLTPLGPFLWRRSEGKRAARARDRGFSGFFSASSAWAWNPQLASSAFRDSGTRYIRFSLDFRLRGHEDQGDRSPVERGRRFVFRRIRCQATH